MNKPFYNDQAHIAEEFQLFEEFTLQTARLAFFKINSYKLSFVNSAFCMSREALSDIIKGTLLNYTEPADVLADVGFFAAEADN